MHLLKRIHRIFFSFFLGTSALAPALGQSATQPAGTLTVTVTVSDKKHSLVTDLKAGDFNVYDNDQPQQIASFRPPDVPACLGLLVDNSGSMRQQHAAVVTAMLDLVKAGNPEDRIFVVNFNDQPFLDQDYTKDIHLIEQGLRPSNPRGGTALYDALIASADHLANTPACEKRILVVVSDGEDNESRKSLQQTMEATQNPRSPVIYAIGLPFTVTTSRVPRGPRALEAIVTPTGGELFFLGNLKDLNKTVLKLAEDIRNQYTITYIPSDSQLNGAFHKIRVELAAPEQKDDKVHGRAGYFARK